MKESDRAREVFERNKAKTPTQKSRQVSLATVLSLFSLIVSIATAYSTFLEQKDHLTVITGQTGTFVYRYEDMKKGNFVLNLAGGTITFFNNGNRQIAILEVSIEYYQYQSSHPPKPEDNDCKNDDAFFDELFQTTFKPVILKPGDILASAVSLLDEPNKTNGHGEALLPRARNMSDNDWGLSCISIDFATADSRENRKLTITSAKVTHPDFSAYLEEDYSERGKQRKQTRIVVKRNVTTIAWLNDSLEYIYRHSRDWF